MLSVGWGHGYAKLIWGAWLRTGGCEVLLREDDRVAAIVRVDQVDQVAEVVGEPELRGRLVPGLNVPLAAVLAGPALAATCWRPRGPNPVNKCGSGPSAPCPTQLQCECDHVAGAQVACWYQGRRASSVGAGGARSGGFQGVPGPSRGPGSPAPARTPPGEGPPRGFPDPKVQSSPRHLITLVIKWLVPRSPRRGRRASSFGAGGAPHPGAGTDAGGGWDTPTYSGKSGSKAGVDDRSFRVC